MTTTISTPFTEGEVPVAPLTYQFQDSDGAALEGVDNTWTAVLRIKHSDGTTVELDATVDNTATATYEWADGDLDVPGVDVAEFHITDGILPVVVSDRIIWRVRAAIPAPAS